MSQIGVLVSKYRTLDFYFLVFQTSTKMPRKSASPKRQSAPQCSQDYSVVDMTVETPAGPAKLQILETAGGDTMLVRMEKTATENLAALQATTASQPKITKTDMKVCTDNLFKDFVAPVIGSSRVQSAYRSNWLYGQHLTSQLYGVDSFGGDLSCYVDLHGLHQATGRIESSPILAHPKSADGIVQSISVYAAPFPEEGCRKTYFALSINQTRWMGALGPEEQSQHQQQTSGKSGTRPTAECLEAQKSLKVRDVHYMVPEPLVVTRDWESGTKKMKSDGLLAETELGTPEKVLKMKQAEKEDLKQKVSDGKSCGTVGGLVQGDFMAPGMCLNRLLHSGVIVIQRYIRLTLLDAIFFIYNARLILSDLPFSM